MSKFPNRKRYLIHPSSQFKYIGMTVLPAFLMSIFCTYFLMTSGEIFLAKENTQVAVEVASIGFTVRQLSQDKYPPEAIAKVEVLKKRLINLEENLRIEYYQTMEKWAKTKMAIIFMLSVILVFAGTISLLFSHRIAGPILRLTRSIDILAQGKDIPPFHFRSYDRVQRTCRCLRSIKKKSQR